MEIRSYNSSKHFTMLIKGIVVLTIFFSIYEPEDIENLSMGWGYLKYLS